MNTENLTWSDLCQLEPKLIALDQVARLCALQIRERIRRRVQTWAEVKRELYSLVGWGRIPPGYTPPPPFQRDPDDVPSFGEMLPAWYDELDKKRQIIAGLTPQQQQLYGSPAWDVAYKHLQRIIEGRFAYE